jgi:anaerobic selenocysteine-containing dehydrogenase
MALSIYKTVCPHDCPDTCSILATVEDARVTACDGDPDHPFTQGFLCHKVHRHPERIYSPLRIPHPMRRAGQKGEGRFARISWDEALAEVAGAADASSMPGSARMCLPASSSPSPSGGPSITPGARGSISSPRSN